MTDEFDIRTIDVGLSSTIVQLFKLPQQMIDYLWERIDIAKKESISCKKELSYIPKVSHSYNLEDPSNLVVQNLYKILFNPVDNPKMFEFINSEVRHVYKRMNQEDSLEPYLEGLWVNFQKKGEFIPLHSHGGMFSFVIWMDIPYDYKDESKLPFAESGDKDPYGGNFTFATASAVNRGMVEYIIKMSPETNGYCCFFPSDLCHQVYPFYTSDKDRISISGNIMYHSTKPNPPPVYQFPFHTSET